MPSPGPVLASAASNTPATTIAAPTPATATASGPVWENDALEGVESEPTTAGGRALRAARNAALVAALVVVVAYASGIWFVPLWLANLAGHLPAADSVVWRLAFPLTSLLNPGALTAVLAGAVPGTVVDITGLPFFSEAAPFFLVGVGLEVVVSVYVCHLRTYRMNDALGSLACGLLNQVGGAAFAISMAPAYTAIWEAVGWSGASVTSPVSWWVGFLWIDFGYYAFHRASHELAWMWASHGVHHSSEEYNLTTALRQNLMDGVFGFAVYLPAALFVPLPLAAAHKSFNLLWQYYIHTRTVGRLGPLEWVLNTPSHHRVHHARNPAGIDRNFAGVFIIWDRLLGTFVDEGTLTEPLVFGVVPPIRGFSPLWANVVEWQGLLDRALAAPGLLPKLSLLCRRPGTRYSPKAAAFTYAPVPPVGHRVNPAGRWDPGVVVHPALAAYVWAHFALLAAVFFVGGAAWRAPSTAALGALIFGVSLHALTGFFEGDPWAPFIDAVRCAALAAVAATAAAAATNPATPTPLLRVIPWAASLPLSPAVATAAAALFAACVVGNLAAIVASPALRAAAAAKCGAAARLASWYAARFSGAPLPAPAAAPAADAAKKAA